MAKNPGAAKPAPKSKPYEFRHSCPVLDCTDNFASRQEMLDHRKETHDVPMGVTHHTEYYCGMIHNSSQITLVEPAHVTVETREDTRPSLGFSPVMNGPYFVIRAEDQDPEQFCRDIALKLSRKKAVKLAYSILEAAGIV